MSLLGKILLFVNLVAAAALAYLTAQDWAARQEANGLLLRYQMTLDGVQIDEPPGADAGGDEIAMAIRTAPGHTTTTVSKKLLNAHFDGSAPKSQLDEVRTVKGKIDGLVTNAADNAAKLRILCGGMGAQNQFEPGLLMRFADSFEERQAVRAMALTRNPKDIEANLANARDRLERKFNAVLSPPEPASAKRDADRLAELQGKLAANPPDAEAAREVTAILAQGSPGYSRDETDRRNRIAQLLMLHDPAQPNQARTIKVVGLRTYARALSEQTGQVEEIIRRVERQIEQDQARYQNEYELLKRLAVQQDQLLYQQQRVVAGLQNQAADDDAHVSQRQTQLRALESNLQGVSTTVAGLLKDQAEVEKALLDVQRRVGDTLRGNFDLEGKLLTTEGGK